MGAPGCFGLEGACSWMEAQGKLQIGKAWHRSPGSAVIRAFPGLPLQLRLPRSPACQGCCSSSRTRISAASFQFNLPGSTDLSQPTECPILLRLNRTPQEPLQMNGKGLGKVQTEQEKANVSGALTNRNSSSGQGGNFRIVGNGSRLAPRNIKRNNWAHFQHRYLRPWKGTRRRHLHRFLYKVWCSDRETNEEESGKRWLQASLGCCPF
jgi:hypothetical protein